jgi:hypothetical protein
MRRTKRTGFFFMDVKKERKQQPQTGADSDKKAVEEEAIGWETLRIVDE